MEQIRDLLESAVLNVERKRWTTALLQINEAVRLILREL